MPRATASSSRRSPTPARSRCPLEVDYAEHVYHLFVVQTSARDSLQRYLSAADVQTGIHYPVPVHLQPAYAALGHKAGDFPNAERSRGACSRSRCSRS